MIGLVTSLLSGGAVWAWQRVKNVRVLRAKAAFFGFETRDTCLVILNRKWDAPGSTSHHDVHAMIEAVIIAKEAGCMTSVLSAEEFHGSNGDRAEFCIGGPESNARTGGHLASQLPGVTVLPHHATRPDTAAFVVDEQQFLLARGREEHAIVAKFTPPGASRPVILICGQTALANRAAISYLNREHRELAKTVESQNRFCIVIKAASTETYGHQAASLERDVSAAAFSAS
ncbi:hypothetical protein [Parafrankia sp. CH37]|uniref:hypothetical protein n=1 Tax=Parafrankia sp. CH37 TaxID=683308 RepID=UPI002896D67A|nr:hypothetical protein [Parafrankia sp. CH37]